ncbi:hypothetical protein BVRB_9g215130 [Beta vulgaris subsp. vulgaris]|nr:hypothetical protein BVRB_9g215130 [Beta vulgaris subsp. vulgaris]
MAAGLPQLVLPSLILINNGISIKGTKSISGMKGVWSKAQSVMS